MTDTREAWLLRAVAALRSRFDAVGYPIPERVHVSVGFGSRRALRGANGGVTMGQCWGHKDGCEASADKVPHIFISPLHANGIAVLPTLVHELGHAALPANAKHGAKFVKFCKAIGLEGKPTSTHAGEELHAELERLNVRLGVFPHAELDARKLPKPGGTRLLKVACPECDYTVRVTRTWLDMGAPICPLDNVSMEEA